MQPEPGATAAQTPAHDAARVAVHVEFVPPLAAPARLCIEHECGERQVVATGCASVDLMLLPGPVVLVLEIGGSSRENTARVAAGMPPIVWQLGRQ
ncbi:MAG TPA: hypothetical protein VF384_04840 [Planctomycetota bacterium]